MYAIKLIGGGGYPIPGLDGEGGYPIQLIGGGRIPHHSGPGGYPIPGLDGLLDGGYPWVPPPSRTGWNTPPPPIMRQNSIGSTCYAAGGMPLAFTQDDFLVVNHFTFRAF